MPKIRGFDRITALYERLSKDDEQQEKASILGGVILILIGFFEPSDRRSQFESVF